MARHLPVPLKPSEIGALVKSALEAVNLARTESKRFAAWRDFVMIQTSLLAGLRVGELCALKVDHVNVIDGVLNVIEGKGSVDRNVPICSKLSPILVEWIGERRSGFMFPARNGRPISCRAFQYRLEDLGRAAKIEKRVHPHMLRHSFATELAKNNVNLFKIQRLLGHAYIATTQVYVHVSIDDLRDAVNHL